MMWPFFGSKLGETRKFKNNYEEMCPSAGSQYTYSFNYMYNEFKNEFNRLWKSGIQYLAPS